MYTLYEKQAIFNIEIRSVEKLAATRSSSTSTHESGTDLMKIMTVGILSQLSCHLTSSPTTIFYELSRVKSQIHEKLP
eukprot:g59609.t1